MNNIMENKYQSYYFFIILCSVSILGLAIYSFNQLWYVTGCLLAINGLISLIIGGSCFSAEKKINLAIKKQNEIIANLEQQKKEEEKRIRGLIKISIIEQLVSALKNRTPIDTLAITLASLSSEERKYTLNEAFNKVTSIIISDEIIDDYEEQFLTYFKTNLGFHPKQLIESNIELYDLADVLLSLKKILNGKVPYICTYDLPQINFQKNEVIIYLSVGVSFYEDLHGFRHDIVATLEPIRIGVGIYYKRDGFDRSFVNVSGVKCLAGLGKLILTTQNIYYYTREKCIKIPYDKILTIVPYGNAISIQKNGVTSKQLIFEKIDGWFTYNVLKNAKNIKL